VPENFPPGSVMLFQTQMQGLDAELDSFCARDAQEAFGDLSLCDLNVVLYRADGEERDATQGQFGAYDVPQFGKLVYCGLEGWMHPLRHIMRYNDLGHPLCEHLRAGTWALDYAHARLERYGAISFLEPHFRHVPLGSAKFHQAWQDLRNGTRTGSIA
jgi:glycogen debranching enzyme